MIKIMKRAKMAGKATEYEENDRAGKKRDWVKYPIGTNPPPPRGMKRPKPSPAPPRIIK